MRRVGSVIALVALSTGCGKSLVAPPPPVHWETNADRATSIAKAEHKLLFVYVGAAWDTAAKQLEHETFVDPEVRTVLARHYVSLHIDMTDDEDPRLRGLTERFKVVGDPALIVLRADVITEIVRFNEFMPPRPLARILSGATKADGAAEAQREEAIYRDEQEARREAQRQKTVITPLP